MIPVRIRHRNSRRNLGFTAFSLKDQQSGQAVANWIVATLQYQGVLPVSAELRIGSKPWKLITREDKPDVVQDM